MTVPRDIIPLLKLDTSRLAQGMTFSQRVMFGPLMFDLISRSIRCDLDQAYPGATPDEIDRMLIQRLQEVKDFEDCGSEG